MNIQGFNEQPYISPREAAQMLGTRLDAIYSLIWAGRLQAEKRDGRWFVDRRAVEARVRKRTAQPTTLSELTEENTSESISHISHLNACHSESEEEA